MNTETRTPTRPTASLVLLNAIQAAHQLGQANRRGPHHRRFVSEVNYALCGIAEAGFEFTAPNGTSSENAIREWLGSTLDLAYGRGQRNGSFDADQELASLLSNLKDEGYDLVAGAVELQPRKVIPLPLGERATPPTGSVAQAIRDVVEANRLLHRANGILGDAAMSQLMHELPDMWCPNDVTA